MNQYLSFDINSKPYLFDISQIHSIIKKRSDDIRSLPEAPPFFIGLTQLRETTIGVICASMIFDGVKLSSREEYDLVIVRSKEDELYGITVDQVHGVISIQPDKLTSNSMMGELNPYVLNVYNDSNKLHLLVDVNKLIKIKNLKEVI